MFTIRRGYLEIGRRVTERGVFATPDDVFFRGRSELYDVFREDFNEPLITAKIAARRRDFVHYDRKEVALPRYLQHNSAEDAAAHTRS